MHFHIGASITAMTFYGKYPWDSHPMDTKLAISGTMLFIGNARGRHEHDPVRVCSTAIPT